MANDYEFPRDAVSLLNRRTGEIKLQKIGWSWTCLFFSGVLGIPLFLRRLNIWGGLMVLIWAVNFFVNDFTSQIGLIFLTIGLSVFFAVRANCMAGKHYLENGWEFSDPASAEAKLAREKWGLLSIT